MVRAVLWRARCGAPGGQQVGYAYDLADRAVSAIDPFPINFVKNAVYAPFGGLTSAALGAYNTGFPGTTISNSYNNRLQPTVISAASPTMTVMSLSYNFNQGVAPNPKNNGNVVAIQNNRDSTRSQNFTYDALNRIQQAYTTSNKWGEAFSIDAWGNLWKRDPIAGKTNYEALSTTALTSNRLSGFSYDAAGNMLNDGGHAYTYDAENRIITGGGMNYVYDGDGNRVKKYSGTTGTLYWPGRENEILNESDLSTSTWKHFVFFNGQRVARRDWSTGNVYYFLKDHLGTLGVTIDSLGQNILQESDYYPYGGEQVITNTLADQHFKFTGKERDAESGLDYFGARHFGSGLGRFTSVDPSGISIDKNNPQSWNRYSHTLNNPLRFVDLNGKWPTEIHNMIIDKAFPGLSTHQRSILKEASRRVDILIPGQLDSHSHDHAMKSVNDKDVKTARAQIDSLIAGKEEAAAKENHKGFFVSDKAMNIFGEAGHTVMDRTSPAHTDENGDPKEWHISDANEHRKQEANITLEQLNTAVEALRNAYYDTFGNAAGKQATQSLEIENKEEKEPI